VTWNAPCSSRATVAPPAPLPTTIAVLMPIPSSVRAGPGSTGRPR
jgi:hypothetical protein